MPQRLGCFESLAPNAATQLAAQTESRETLLAHSSHMAALNVVAAPAGTRVGERLAGSQARHRTGVARASVQIAIAPAGRGARHAALHGGLFPAVASSDAGLKLRGRAGAATRPASRRSLHVCAAGAAGRKVRSPWKRSTSAPDIVTLTVGTQGGWAVRKVTHVWRFASSHHTNVHLDGTHEMAHKP